MLEMMASESILQYEQRRPVSQKFGRYQIKKPSVERPRIQCWRCSMYFPNTLDLEEHVEHDHGREIVH